MTLQSARSFLFVPASRPDRIAKALASAADCVIVDLEDAVAAPDKPGARVRLVEALHSLQPTHLTRLLVRINGCDTEWHETDLRALAPWCSRGIGGVMVPKSESAGALQGVALALGARASLLPLVESLAGVDALDLIARAKQVVRLAFGNLDFQLDLGMKCAPGEPELAAVRFAIVAASRRNGLPAPVDGVTVDLSEASRLESDALDSRGFGFGAKLCIHPAQIPLVNRAFSPSAAELEWARRVVAAARASGGEAVSVDGKMVDVPVIRLAERTLGEAGLPRREASM